MSALYLPTLICSSMWNISQSMFSALYSCITFSGSSTSLSSLDKEIFGVTFWHCCSTSSVKTLGSIMLIGCFKRTKIFSHEKLNKCIWCRLVSRHSFKSACFVAEQQVKLVVLQGIQPTTETLVVCDEVWPLNSFWIKNYSKHHFAFIYLFIYGLFGIKFSTSACLLGLPDHVLHYNSNMLCCLIFNRMDFSHWIWWCHNLPFGCAAAHWWEILYHICAKAL